tara:strand:+ start:6567 stop:7142 length:576 start_codon:yes stop_codon:yes gene_type:complete
VYNFKFFLNSCSEFKFKKIVLILNYILAVGITSLISSCGYVIEGSNPVLPNDAKSIAVLPIQNNTFKGGLETDLSEKLKSLLQNNSSVKLLPAGQADLQLNVTLLSLELPSSGLSKDQVSKGMQAVLKGKAFLKDRSKGNTVWGEKMIQVKIAESEGNQVENAASLMLSGNIRELINRFSQNLYDSIFTNF